MLHALNNYMELIHKNELPTQGLRDGGRDGEGYIFSNPMRFVTYKELIIGAIFILVLECVTNSYNSLLIYQNVKILSGYALW